MNKGTILFVMVFTVALIYAKYREASVQPSTLSSGLVPIPQEPARKIQKKQKIQEVSQEKIKDRKETSLIIIHHSATENGNAEIFRRFHKETNGWDDIGYHFVITNGKGGPDGEIQKGRGLQKQGAHARGRNHNSIGICLVGNNKFTEKQKEALIRLLVKLCIMYQIDPSEKTIQAHHEKCPGPGFDLPEIIRWLEVEIL